jgi:hypothetical protein
MKFEIGKLTIGELISLYENDRINLQPRYQRNAVWSKSSKQLLLDTIMSNLPLPNFFFHDKGDDIFDMVDGQQRTRTIIAYYNNQLEDHNGRFYDASVNTDFMTYEIPLVTITEVDDDNKIEAFYARVNSAGSRLNRPELLKAKFFETSFLKLIEELASLPEYERLNLFTESSQNRMNDIDFTAELVGLLKLGRTDKKSQIDKIFDNDLTAEECTQVSDRFCKIIDIFSRLDKRHPIRKSRYRQRNDFYTLFDFISNNMDKPLELIDHIYDTLILFDDDIVPSNDCCEPFQNYALHCVSQSNSKAARDARYNIIMSLFGNKFDNISDNMSKILDFYELDSSAIIDVAGYSMFDLNILKDFI